MQSDPPTFEQVYRAELAHLVRLATFMLDSTAAAEDAVHDSFLELHRNWFNVDNPNGYVQRAVVNRCRDLMRRNKRAAAKLHLLGDAGEHPDDQAATAGATDLLNALRDLTPRKRMIVVLRFYGGYRLAEIAEVLALPIGTVQSNLYRALAQLEEVLPDGSRV